MTASVLILAACSEGPSTRYLFNDFSTVTPPRWVCDRGGQRSMRTGKDTSLPDKPYTKKIVCDLAGDVLSPGGWGTIVLRSGPESYLGVCGVHYLPTRLRGPISFEHTIFELIDDPIVAFKLRGLVAGIDIHREFHRVINFDGVHVELEQFIANETPCEMGLQPCAPYIEIEINGCNAPPDDTVIADDGARIHFDTDP